jgi:hypothetical protein
LKGTHSIIRPLIKSRKFEVLLYNPYSIVFLSFLYSSIRSSVGAVIIQDKKPISLYSRKLNTAHKWYTTTERVRELLSAIETCKEYKNTLLGYHEPIIVFTDHKNNTFNGLKASSCVLRTCWLLLLEEYGVTFEYLPGKISVNTVAGALSSLDIDSLKIQEEEMLMLVSESETTASVISN